MTSILAPFLISSADGTWMICPLTILVVFPAAEFNAAVGAGGNPGCAPGEGPGGLAGAGGATVIASNSMSKRRTDSGPILGG